MLAVLPQEFYFRLVGLNSSEALYYNDFEDGQHLFIYQDGDMVSFYGAVSSNPTNWLISRHAVKVSCHATYNLSTGEKELLKETPFGEGGSCLVQYPEDLSGEDLDLRYTHACNTNGNVGRSELHMGVMDEDKLPEAWDILFSQTTDDGQVIFVVEDRGEEEYSQSYPSDYQW